MELIVEQMKAKSKEHSEAFENSLLLMDDLMVDEDKAAIRNLRNSMGEAVRDIQAFVDATVSGKEKPLKTPRATQRFNQGKRRLAKIMDDMIDVSPGNTNRFNEYISYLESYSK